MVQWYLWWLRMVDIKVNHGLYWFTMGYNGCLEWETSWLRLDDNPVGGIPFSMGSQGANGRFFWWKILLKWIKTRATPIFGKPTRTRQYMGLPHFSGVVSNMCVSMACLEGIAMRMQQYLSPFLNVTHEKCWRLWNLPGFSHVPPVETWSLRNVPTENHPKTIKPFHLQVCLMIKNHRKSIKAFHF